MSPLRGPDESFRAYRCPPHDIRADAERPGEAGSCASEDIAYRDGTFRMDGFSGGRRFPESQRRKTHAASNQLPRPTRAAALGTAVLTVDALVHLDWTTGVIWPAADEGSLSRAVLGTDVPFTPPILLPDRRDPPSSHIRPRRHRADGRQDLAARVPAGFS